MILSQPSLASPGGAECACMMLLERFQDNYDVTLITSRADIEKLNPIFETNVDQDKLTIITPFSPRLLGILEHKIHLFAKLQTTLLNRYIRKQDDVYDIRIACKQEGNLGHPGLQFIHHPPDSMVSSPLQKVYLWILSLLGRKTSKIAENITICWGDYLKALYEKTYGERAESIMTYSRPPSRFKHHPWHHRQDGFLAIGRICPEKKTHQAIKIIDTLIDNGYTTHLHIIGSGHGYYYQKIRRMASTRGYISMEGYIPADRYYDLIAQHKYILHCRENEPSAQTIIDGILGGCIPFAHHSGGNPQILNYNQELTQSLLYHTPNDAVQHIQDIYHDVTTQHILKTTLDTLTFNTREDVLNKIETHIKNLRRNKNAT